MKYSKLTLGERLQRNRQLKPFLKELEELVGREVSEDELVDPEVANSLRDEMNATSEEEKMVCEILFKQRGDGRLGNYMENLSKALEGSIYMA